MSEIEVTVVKSFQIWLVVFGLVVAGIAAAHLFGGQATYIGGGSVNATMDSDLRFYNVLFLAYGCMFIWTARDPRTYAALVNLLGLLFFLGGVARLLAWMTSGAPSVFYQLMIPVEPVIPVVHWAVLRRLRQADQSNADIASTPSS
ncbi:DUF4345 domain-containing protein [Gordonia sputi]|uniref:DUF4345 domain-containing protein n=1 Tax=Gordonia sputi TaxID=36823 RepID=UPI0028B036F6|nr:DUF4345 domain-containing protein [Gordonia sputi]